MKKQSSAKLVVSHTLCSNLYSDLLASADGGIRAGNSSEPNDADEKKEEAMIKARPIGKWLTAVLVYGPMLMQSSLRRYIGA